MKGADDGTRLLATWMGDEIRVERIGDRYALRAVSRDGSFSVEGTGVRPQSTSTLGSATATSGPSVLGRRSTS